MGDTRRPTRRWGVEPNKGPIWIDDRHYILGGTLYAIPPDISPQPVREISATRSILDNVIPACYGARKVTGQIGAWSYSGYTARILKLGVIFAYGEQDSISSLYINGEAASGLDWVTSYALHVGDGSTAISSILTGMTGWTADDTTLWKNYAHAGITIDCALGAVPSSLTISVELGGQIITDFRTSTDDAWTNPVLVAYDIMTNSDWRGLATTKIHEDSWEMVADWCDEDVSGSDRYTFNGIIYDRDPDSAMAAVLGHCLAYPYIDADGKVRLWCEMPPVAITGDWSASASTTVTEDASSGAATTELAAGDYVYVGEYLRKVVSVTDDDTFVVDSALTVSGVKVRPTSNLYIEKHDWATIPAARESNLLETPDKMRIRFGDGDVRGSHEVEVSYGVGTDKIVETTLVGCIDAGVATRIAETSLNVAHLQEYYWAGTIRGELGAQMEPGDVVLLDTDVLTLQAARVLPPVTALSDGTYQIALREYDPLAYSDSTDTNDSVPAQTASWDSEGKVIFRNIDTIDSGTSTQYDLVDFDVANTRVRVGDSTIPTQMTSTNVRLPNNVPVYGLKVGGSPVELIKVDTSDQVHIGDGGETIYLEGTEFLLGDAVYMKGGHTDKKSLIGYNGSDTCFFGNSTTNCTYSGNLATISGTGGVAVASGNDVDITPASGYHVRITSNNRYLQGRETGSTYRNLIGVSSSDVISVGDANIPMALKGLDEIAVRVDGAEIAKFDDDATAGNTRFLIYDVDNGTVERVSVGAADSGGSGYKVLRIPN